MGNRSSKEPPPPPPRPRPMVLVPLPFDFPPPADHTRMLVPAYDLLFGKLELRRLFEDYYEHADKINVKFEIETPHTDLISAVSEKISGKPEEILGANEGELFFRWQRNGDDPNTFMDLLVPSPDPTAMRLRSSTYNPKYGFGAFCSLPLLMSNRMRPEDNGYVGLRFASKALSLGSIFYPTPLSGNRTPTTTPPCAWIINRAGGLSVGLKYKPCEAVHSLNFKELENWSCAIGYVVGSRSPMHPSLSVALELDRGSELTASLYYRMVVQRRVPLVFAHEFEDRKIVGITNYIDFGLEFKTRLADQLVENIANSSFQLATSWQINEYLLVKGKVGHMFSSAALVFKSWWLTFSFTATCDYLHEPTLGFSIHFRNSRQRRVSYQMVDPNYVMSTPNTEQLGTTGTSTSQGAWHHRILDALIDRPL